ncbi:double-strand break repair helicase AddA [Methyloferula stellata]|uniref:double-strand break repair helicase AddA n=1 Tax=Methyloferula stellata TaxID=876270 RepID=UPI00036F844B|nr:double-strand break repair helicase AddA [Methyloferula stellata]
MTLANDIPHDTRVRQHNASDPAQSVWVSANAGSGKTHVLVQRVLRLLLNGVPPAKILCLTFTKAAAANMAQRVFEALAEWTRLDDQALRAAIIETGATARDNAVLIFARRLFARTVETPGGLKIQTIHAFCERLLHVFPFEANVPARFEVLEDLRQAGLLEQARLDVLTYAAQDRGMLGAHLERLVTETSDDGFEGIVQEAMRHAFLFRKMPPSAHEARLRRALLLSPDDSTASVTREMIEGGIPPARWNEIAAFLDQSSKVTDQGRAALFREAAGTLRMQQPEVCADFYLQIFFTEEGKGTPAKNLMTGTPAKARPDLLAELQSEQRRLETLRDKGKAVAIVERTNALLAIAREVFARYEHFKGARGLLDFNDLIEKTLALLARSDARWVLYKLDRGIDHILVDEAQDTSEAQWKILKELMSDFGVGAGAGSTARTFFAVGDDKQSIFSFQGAAPHMFHQMRRMLEKKFKAGNEAFAHVELNMSFRSVPAVLNAVDRIFDRPEHKKGVVEDIWIEHAALKRDLPGLIEFWPLAGAQQRDAPSDWSLPLDALDEQDPPSIVANRIAAKIADLLGSFGEYVFDSKTRLPRNIRASDILILVRTRGPFFEAVIRALKQSNVPVAGADRLELTAHIAVMDLIAVGRVALLPQDDLSLATVLKSPLVGLDDDDLMMIAPRRTGSLFEALAQSPVETHKQAFAKVSTWRLRAAKDLPFAFYMRLLSEDNGRRDMEARLGPEACDAMDEFLRLALLHETEPAPSLSLFLDGLEKIDLTVKRDMETSADAVRVMTVHAAKGLEAKIVFLPDTCGAPGSHHDPKLFALRGADDDTILAWSPRKAEDCTAVAVARQHARDTAEEEYRRLLYVALTRAEERLYIAGFHGARAPQPECWYGMIKAALESDLEPFPAFWNREETLLRRFSPGTRPVPPPVALAAKHDAAPALPDCLRAPVAYEAAPRPPLRPSSALAAADAFEIKAISTAQRGAMRRGQLMHVLLQYLPAVAPERRSSMSEAFLAARAEDLEPLEHAKIVEDVLAVIDAPELVQLFAPGSKAEVPIAGRIIHKGTPIDVIGQVDRIAENETHVLVADFKTGQPCNAGDTPHDYLIQMALYRAALAPLWPQKQLRMLLIWTYGPKIVTLSESALDHALAAL